MGSKDSGHVGDFIIGQFSSCFFFVHDLQPGENVIQVEIKFVAPWKWYQPSFTTFVKLTNPFYDASYPWKRQNSMSKIDLVSLHCHKGRPLTHLLCTFHTIDTLSCFCFFKTNELELKIDIEYFSWRGGGGDIQRILRPSSDCDLFMSRT